MQAISRDNIKGSRYNAAFDTASQGLDELFRQLTEERRAAAGQGALLKKHPQARRLVMIRNDRRFQTWGLFQNLLEEARASQQPETAELAFTVAESLDPERYGETRIADFRAAALGALGNARRRLADLDGAREAFEQAVEILDEGTGDPLEKAELESLRAQLFRDLGYEEQAERSLRKVRTLCLRIGHPVPADDASPLAPQTPSQQRRNGTR